MSKTLKPASLEIIVEETGKQVNAALHHMRYGGSYFNGQYRAPEQPEVSVRTVQAALKKLGYEYVGPLMSGPKPKSRKSAKP